MKPFSIGVFVYLISVVTAASTAPLVLASHLLVKGLKDELDHDNATPHSGKSATNVLKRLITECSSDIYLIINQPGLKASDTTVDKADNWPFLRKYFTLASTTLGLTWVKDSIDLVFLEQYVIKTCDAEAIQVLLEDENEVGHYIDTRKRVIRVELTELPEDDSRGLIIKNNDELIRKILRKVPSPHFTIIMTSTELSATHPVPANMVRQLPEKFEPFSDIFNHPSRANEVEKNDRFKKTEPTWSDDRNTVNRYFQNRKKDEIHLFKDNPLWEKHSQLVNTMVLMVVSLFMFKIILFTRNVGPKVRKQE